MKPYTFNPQPFLADKNSAMQGYVTSEPYAVETQGKFKPKIFLLADQGLGSYSTLIETRRDLVEKKPDLVQRFVDASIIGWCNYLYGDNAAANARIKRDNPEMSDALIAYSIAKMKEYGIVDSGDSLKRGIGAMTDARMKSFFDKMVAVGVVKAGIDYKKAYTPAIREQGRGRRPAAEVTAREGGCMRALLTLLFCITLSATAQAADPYPSRPIKLLIPFPPAGITDLSGRIVAEGLRAKLNQPFVIENKPGANGVIGLREMLKAEPTATR